VTQDRPEPKVTVVIRFWDRKANVVHPVYREGKTKNNPELIDITIVIRCSSPGQDGQNGRDGINGMRGELGFQGPPGRKVSLRSTVRNLERDYSLSCFREIVVPRVKQA
jgi:hypothetical protein